MYGSLLSLVFHYHIHLFLFFILLRTVIEDYKTLTNNGALAHLALCISFMD